MWSELYKWRGVLIIAALAFATLWFAVTGDLELYISPSSAWVAVPMAALALGLCAAWVVSRRRGEDALHDGHDHEHEHDVPVRLAPRVAQIAGGLVVGAFTAATVILPPATLSAATAAQRDVTSSATVSGATSVSEASAAGSTLSITYGLGDWSSLLNQTTDASFYAGRPADVEGFITPDPAGDPDVFYLTRFLITHCAVDAQPVAVPVYQPGWDLSLDSDEWVRVAGEFDTNRGTLNASPIALVPAEVEQIAEPDEPYLF